MQKETMKKYYLASGIFIGIATIIGIIRLFDIILGYRALTTLGIVGIIALVIALFIIIAMVIHAHYIEKRQSQQVDTQQDDPNKLKQYAPKRSRKGGRR